MGLYIEHPDMRNRCMYHDKVEVIKEKMGGLEIDTERAFKHKGSKYLPVCVIDMIYGVPCICYNPEKTKYFHDGLAGRQCTWMLVPFKYLEPYMENRKVGY